MKNVSSRSKLLLCFRPVVDVDLMQESKAVEFDRSRNRALTNYVDVGVNNTNNNKEGMMMKASTTTTCSVSETKDQNSIVIHRPPAPGGKRTFSRVIKAVVFEIILAKRVGDRKGIGDQASSYSSNHNFTLRSCDKKSLNKVQHTPLDSNSVSSISPSSSSSSSSTSTTTSSSASSSSPSSTQIPKGRKPKTSSSTSADDNHQQQHEILKPNSSSSSKNSAICLLLVSLAVTIFWGKICAILFTSIWLYFLHHHQSPAAVVGKLGNSKRRPEKKSSDYKKRVILMEAREAQHRQRQRQRGIESLT